MSQGMDTATELLKEVYVGRINDQMDSEPTTYNRIKKSAGNSEKYGGKWVEFPIHIERNSGIGARGEREALPNAGRQKYREAKINLKSYYAAVELTGQAFDLAKTDYQSFASLVSEETTRIKDDVIVDRNRQVYGNNSGVITTVDTVEDQVITLGSAGVRKLQDGMRLDIMVGATAVVRTTVEVSDIDISLGTVTVVGSLAGVIANDSLVRQGNYGKEWTGLNAIIDDASSLYGIAPTNGPTGSRLWRAHVNNQGGSDTAISEAAMARMSDRIGSSGGKVTSIYSNPGVYRAYWQLLKGERRFVNTIDFGGGYKGLSFTSPKFGDIPFLSDDMSDPGTMYFVNEKELDIYSPYSYELMDRGGATWRQKSDADGVYDIWQSWLVERSEMGTKRRNTHGKITNIIEDAY